MSSAHLRCRLPWKSICFWWSGSLSTMSPRQAFSLKGGKLQSLKLALRKGLALLPSASLDASSVSLPGAQSTSVLSISMASSSPPTHVRNSRNDVNSWLFLGLSSLFAVFDLHFGFWPRAPLNNSRWNDHEDNVNRAYFPRPRKCRRLFSSPHWPRRSRGQYGEENNQAGIFEDKGNKILIPGRLAPSPRSLYSKSANESFVSVRSERL